MNRIVTECLWVNSCSKQHKLAAAFIPAIKNSAPRDKIWHFNNLDQIFHSAQTTAESYLLVMQFSWSATLWNTQSDISEICVFSSVCSSFLDLFCGSEMKTWIKDHNAVCVLIWFTSLMNPVPITVLGYHEDTPILATPTSTTLSSYILYVCKH